MNLLKMTKKVPVIASCAVLVFVLGCADTFIVSKAGKDFVFGREASVAYQMLCETGDMKAILVDTSLPPEAKEGLYNHICVDRSYAKVAALYKGLTKEQQRELRLSFQGHDYDVNYKEC
ncbi:MAG: hypothetical protein HGA78_10090 [Nitrospirales bacterium]|nr:hypothetical protein [Nitrospirales bacterium]